MTDLDVYIQNAYDDGCSEDDFSDNEYVFDFSEDLDGFMIYENDEEEYEDSE